MTTKDGYIFRKILSRMSSYIYIIIYRYQKVYIIHIQWHEIHFRYILFFFEWIVYLSCLENGINKNGSRYAYIFFQNACFVITTKISKYRYLSMCLTFSICSFSNFILIVKTHKFNEILLLYLLLLLLIIDIP